MLEGQLISIFSVEGTVKLAVHEAPFPQVLVAVNVTLTVPPQAGGAPVLLLVILTLQPPVDVTASNQSAKAVFICSCVNPVVTVRSPGHTICTSPEGG